MVSGLAIKCPFFWSRGDLQQSFMKKPQGGEITVFTLDHEDELAAEMTLSSKVVVRPDPCRSAASPH
jgi:hypothetical protein